VFNIRGKGLVKKKRTIFEEKKTITCGKTISETVKGVFTKPHAKKLVVFQRKNAG